MIDNPQKIVISRTDSIGDVVLTLPLAGILKDRFPDTHIIFLGNTYTKPIIACCEHVDEIWEWFQIEKMNQADQLNWLKTKNIDTFIHVFPRKDLAKLAKKAGIQNRIGTSHRIFHLCTCNYRVNFTRKRSDLHEAQLNTKLLAPFGLDVDYSPEQLYNYSGFTNIPNLPAEFMSLLDTERKNIIFHPKSQGSALEWGVQNFIDLAQELGDKQFKIFFTGTEKESEYFRHLLPKQENIIDLSGKMTLNDLIAFISKADLLLAASTGPLHIAGVSGIVTIGLFSPQKPIDAGRWKPLGINVKIINEEKISSSTQPLDIKIREVKRMIEESL